MTEAPAPHGSEKAIMFRGRELWVKLPTPEQYVVWQRTIKAIQNADTGSWTGEQAIIALERTRKIIDSILLNRIDRDWLDDEWLEGTLDLIGTAQIIQLTTEAFGRDKPAEGDNRAEKRAVAKKAARRKVS